MARPLRVQYPGAFYHVMNRGSGRQTIFYNPLHYNLFFKVLEESVALWEIRIHAFSLMPNHYHLLLETPLGNLSRAMRHIDGVYTQRFNRERGRDGHLFRGRYKAILVEEDAYLVELIRYIHQNPVEASLAERPQQHPWTSHRYYLNDGQLAWLTTDRILGYFGRRRNRAKRKLHDFVMAGVPEELKTKLEGRRWPSVLSSDNFEEWVEWNFVRDLKDREIQYIENKPKGVSEKGLRKALCDLFEIEWDQLVAARSRPDRNCRAKAIWFYRRILKKGYHELSQLFGVRPSRISAILGKKGFISSDQLEIVSRCL